MGVTPPPTVTEARREQLADFLRTRRAAVKPGDVGLPEEDGARRRTPGLRREEVAQLAGVGLSWYTWLEQGRDIRPSPQVLEALARALRLSEAEHRHLFHLCGVERTLPGEAYPRAASAELRAIVEGLAPHPAYLLNPRSDVLAWNRPLARVLHDFGALPPERRNLLLWIFSGDPRWREAPTWEATAKRNLAQFRAEYARRPGDASFAALVEQLTAASPAFRAWWSAHEVLAAEPGEKLLAHATLGPLRLLHVQTVPASEPELRLTLLLPADARTRAVLEALERSGPGS